jgi:hypothetical protein
MTTEIKLRLGLVLILLGLVIMTFIYLEKDRVYHKLRVSSSTQFDSLKEEIEFRDNQIGLRDMIIEEIKMENPKTIHKILKDTEGFAYEK